LFVVDTNILLYAADRDSPRHVRCRDLVERWRAEEPVWYVTPVVVYEFLRGATHGNVFRVPWTAPEAWRFLDALFASSAQMLAPGDRHMAVLGEVLAEVRGIAGNLFYDTQIAVLMREHGVRTIYTHDGGFRRFPFLEVVDPLA
jgi:uncharacterized protein